MAQQPRIQLEKHHNVGRLEVEVGYTLPDQQYPYIKQKKYQRPRLTIFPSTFTVAA
jgi:hypothetical protein